MEFSNYTIILTDECNFNCSYCYQKRTNKYLETSALEKFFNFFLPYLTEESFVNFTGGEPLLAFNQIEQTVEYIEHKNKTLNKKIRYSITTNGSLIEDPVLEFLNHNKFLIILSFDGLAQDLARKKGSYRQLIPVIKKISDNPELDFEINAVFTPETIKYLSKSIQLLIEMGMTNISIALNRIPRWDAHSLLLLEDELASLRKFTLFALKKTGNIPLFDFWRRYKKDIFSCGAGKDRMALAPDGKLWGCYLFPEHLKGKERTNKYKKFCFGTLGSFIKDHKKIYPRLMKNYSNIRMDKFYTDNGLCKECPDLEDCWVCPLDAAFSSTIIGKIPDWTCKINKIFRKERGLFWRELEPLIKDGLHEKSWDMLF